MGTRPKDSIVLHLKLVSEVSRTNVCPTSIPFSAPLFAGDEEAALVHSRRFREEVRGPKEILIHIFMKRVVWQAPVTWMDAERSASTKTAKNVTVWKSTIQKNTLCMVYGVVYMVHSI